jgi:2,4-dienoyl-CoA reductase-like NADH-dependent reductase (Old Yellow Enzyme family)
MGSLSNHPDIPNVAAKNSPYYTPAQSPPSGTAISNGQLIPALFTPLSIRGLTLQNRIVVSPMCQYSASTGALTDWHLTHLGGILQRGPGLTIIEATSVTANGRITPEDSGLWTDSQIAPIKRIVEFAHSQSQLIGIQLAHAGRKASTVAPWLSSSALATEKVGGWPDDVVGPSAVPFNDLMATPRELSIAEIEQLKKDWVAAVKRAVSAGIDVVEIHAAHGYLLSSFHSSASNHRTDQYGGSFENRTRLTREIVQLTRAAMPDSMPLFLRISATDWLEEVHDPEVRESWTVNDTVRFAPTLADLGVDLLDISSGGNHRLQHIHAGPAYQAPFAKAVKKAVGDKMLVSTVGSITEGKLAEEQLEAGLDAVMAGRAFQKNPGLVWSWAEDLGVQIKVANQIGWGFKGRGDVSGRKK